MTSHARTSDVDVLIPVRNGARFLPACLDSVFAQAFPARAIIVVDDGSTDETPGILADYAARWPNVHVIRSEPRGLSHARNLALEASEAPFVAFLDSDDIWLPDKLKKQMALFTSDRPEVGFVHNSFFYIDESGRRIMEDKVIPPRKRGDIFADLLRGYVLSGSSSAVVARRDLVRTIGGFDETLLHAEDWDVWLKLAKASQVDFVPDALTGIRIHGESKQRKNARAKAETFLLNRLRVVDKWIDQVPDGDQMLDRCRIEAIRVDVKNMLRFPPIRGLSRRLRASDVPLARRLFPSRLAYVRSFVRAVGDAAGRVIRKHAGPRASL
jgi:glycosyltransferase involved in cell wall biosynthesis